MKDDVTLILKKANSVCGSNSKVCLLCSDLTATGVSILQPQRNILIFLLIGLCPRPESCSTKIRTEVIVGCKGSFVEEMRPGAQVGVSYEECPEGRKLTGVNI